MYNSNLPKRSFYNDNTWIDPEELCYPSGSMYAGRKACAYDSVDKTNRIVKIGIPDTYFSIPGRVKIKGKTIKIWISIDDDAIVQMYRETE
jgi:hypothetical protein